MQSVPSGSSTSVLALIVGVLTTVGSIVFFGGRQAQKIVSLEKRMANLEDEVDDIPYVPRELFDTHMDHLRSSINDIKERQRAVDDRQKVANRLLIQIINELRSS